MAIKFERLIMVGTIISLWCGCAVSNLERGKARPMMPPLPAAAETSPAAPPPVKVRVLAEESEPFPPELQEVKYSIRLKDADIREALLAMASRCGLNVVFDDPIEGKTSLVLHEVPLPVALKAILRSAGHFYNIKDGIVHIHKFERRTFVINFVYGSSSFGTSGSSGSSGGGSGGGQSGSSSSTRRSSSSGSGSSNGAGGGQFWDDLQDTLTKLKSEKGKVTIDAQSGLIMMEDTQEGLESMEGFLATMQQIINRQVLIDARLLEVELDDEFQMGIDWNVPNLGLGFIAKGTAGSAAADLGSSGLPQLVISSDHVTAVLNMLEKKGNVKVLSSPRLTAINNQPAYISVSEQIPYYTGQVSTETSTVISWTVNFKQAGVVFQLVPQISEDGNLIIRVNHSISEVVGYTDPVRAEPVPIIDVREADTTVRVGNGQTVVIGGLMREKVTETISQVPVLGDIPWLGALFRKTIQSRNKTELVLLLTPRILVAAEDLRESSQELIQEMEKSNHGMYLGPESELLRSDRAKTEE